MQEEIQKESAQIRQVAWGSLGAVVFSLLAASSLTVSAIRARQEFVFSDESQWGHEMLDSELPPHLTRIKDVDGNLKGFKREAFEELQSRKRRDRIPFTTSALLAFGRESSLY
jgi:hypothetical protein